MTPIPSSGNDIGVQATHHSEAAVAETCAAPVVRAVSQSRPCAGSTLSAWGPAHETCVPEQATAIMVEETHAAPVAAMTGAGVVAAAVSTTHVAVALTTGIERGSK